MSLSSLLTFVHGGFHDLLSVLHAVSIGQRMLRRVHAVHNAVRSICRCVVHEHIGALSSQQVSVGSSQAVASASHNRDCSRSESARPS